MTKFVIFIAALTVSAGALAQPNYPALSSALYPQSKEQQAFTAKFFEIVEAHKTRDPLLEGKGPSVSEYSLDKIKFAFVSDETEQTVDLVFFNWKLATFEGLEIQKDFSDFYGSPVYILRKVSKKAVASQGDNQDQLTNFSYLLGANTMEKQIKLDSPNAQVPAQFLDWKPHPAYMDRSHPLRKALDANTLVILSPDKELFFKQTGMTEQMRPYFEQVLNSEGGFYNAIMGMMVHEMFHAKEGEDKVNRLAKGRKIDEDRKAIVEQLKRDQNLRRLIGTYIKIVFSIGDKMKGNFSQAEKDQLSDLKILVSELKSKYSEAWKFIWNYEYTEGFAEYVSTYSMVQVGITTLPQQIDLQKSDNSNNFAYRTGALGGLYLKNRLKTMPFKNNEDHSESIWEIVIRLTQTTSAQASVTGIESKYSSVAGVDEENEINRVVDYLVSTVMDVK